MDCTSRRPRLARTGSLAHMGKPLSHLDSHLAGQMTTVGLCGMRVPCHGPNKHRHPAKHCPADQDVEDEDDARPAHPSPPGDDCRNKVDKQTKRDNGKGHHLHGQHPCHGYVLRQRHVSARVSLSVSLKRKNRNTEIRSFVRRVLPLSDEISVNRGKNDDFVCPTRKPGTRGQITGVRSTCRHKGWSTRAPLHKRCVRTLGMDGTVGKPAAP